MATLELTTSCCLSATSLNTAAAGCVMLVQDENGQLRQLIEELSQQLQVQQQQQQDQEPMQVQPQQASHDITSLTFNLQVQHSPARTGWFTAQYVVQPSGQPGAPGVDLNARAPGSDLLPGSDLAPRSDLAPQSDLVPHCLAGVAGSQAVLAKGVESSSSDCQNMQLLHHSADAEASDDAVHSLAQLLPHR